MKSLGAIPAVFKNERFVIQDKHILKTGTFQSDLGELLSQVEIIDEQVLARLMELQQGSDVQLQQDTTLIFQWAKATLLQYK